MGEGGRAGSRRQEAGSKEQQGTMGLGAGCREEGGWGRRRWMGRRSGESTLPEVGYRGGGGGGVGGAGGGGRVGGSREHQRK